jgi:hypothetical protein
MRIKLFTDRTVWVADPVIALMTTHIARSRISTGSTLTAVF